MPKLIRVSFLTLIGLLLAMHPFAARAQSCNRHGTGSVYVAPPYQPYPGYAVPQSGYYVTTRIPLQGMPPTVTFPEVGETATGMDAGNGESTANMSTANMSGASMSGASMRGANMSGVNAADGSLRRQGVSPRPTCSVAREPDSTKP